LLFNHASKYWTEWLQRNEDNLIANLPKFLAETAFLDRFTGIIPGWKIP